MGTHHGKFTLDCGGHMITVLSFILLLGFLIFIHEMGHYLAARHVGVRVETFSIGFPPKMIGKKYGDTEYILSWIPLGGYVRLFGQNMEDEDASNPTNYAAKTIFQRFYILFAGPAINLLFAFLFMPLVYMAGVSLPQYLLEPAWVSSVQEESFAQKIGIQAGDTIVAVNGKAVENWENISTQLAALQTPDVSLEIERDGYVTTVTGALEDLKKSGAGWNPKIAPVVGGFSETSPIQEAGVQIGDRIVSINGLAVTQWGDIFKQIQQTQSSDQSEETGGVPLQLEIDRQGEIQFFEVTPYYNATTQSYLLGMTVAQTKKSFGFLQSVELGTERLLFLTGMTFQFLGKIITGQGSLDDLGGPIRIGMVIGEAVRTGWAEVFFLMAVISLQLGIFNLLPIPALDGGHIFFLAIEKIKGAPLSMDFRGRTQFIGFALLMVFMIAVTYNDILQLG